MLNPELYSAGAHGFSASKPKIAWKTRFHAIYLEHGAEDDAEAPRWPGAWGMTGGEIAELFASGKPSFVIRFTAHYLRLLRLMCQPAFMLAETIIKNEKAFGYPVQRHCFIRATKSGTKEKVEC